MKTTQGIILSLVAIIQWGIVCAAAGFADNGFSNAFYFISFIIFWLGLATLIWQLFYSLFSKKRK
jgi:hypothetical protein